MNLCFISDSETIEHSTRTMEKLSIVAQLCNCLGLEDENRPETPVECIGLDPRFLEFVAVTE